MAKGKVEIRECIDDLAAVLAKNHNQTKSSLIEDAILSYIAAQSN